MSRADSLFMPSARRFATLAALAAALTASAPAAEAAPSRKSIPSNGNATVVSVDGPGRITLKTAAGRLPVRLYMVDTPEVGECGAAESTAALARLTKGRRARVRYVSWARRPDDEGRMLAIVGPRSADLTERSVQRDLIATEWARTFPAVSISPSDNISLRLAAERYGPRTPQGLWARCGGHGHLPAAEPVPAHAPALWAIDASGITQTIGPIAPAATAAPGEPLRVSDLGRVARVEAVDPGGPECWARVPALELVVVVSVDRKKREVCGTGTVEAIVSAGPGYVSAANGLRAGQTFDDAVRLFPQIPRSFDDRFSRDRSLPLAGTPPVDTSWQTLAARRPRTGKITGFLTSPKAWDS